MNKKERNPRRTKIALERDFMNAIKAVIEEDGFSKTTLAAITEKAGIVPNVFYNRFKSLDDLFDEYIKKFDYWLVDVAGNIQPEAIKDHPVTFENILVALTESLYTNKSMQQILLWELAEENKITSRSAKLREANTSGIVESFDDFYKTVDPDIDIRVVSALFIAGIYYLILHKQRSTFCGVDFNKKEGRELLISNIRELSKLIFHKKDALDETFRIAKNMKNKGIDMDIILEITGLSQEQIEHL